jgi:hypothetical protein
MTAKGASTSRFNDGILSEIQRRATATTRQRRCECGKQSNAAALGNHTKSTGHRLTGWNVRSGLPVNAEEKVKAVVGDQIIATYNQECPLCRRTIYRGDTVKAGAYNLFSDDALWYHPRCADFIIAYYGREVKLVDAGWRQAMFNQRCHDCHGTIRVGRLMYRSWSWPDPTDPMHALLHWVCHNCHRVDTAPRLHTT